MLWIVSNHEKSNISSAIIMIIVSFERIIRLAAWQYTFIEKNATVFLSLSFHHDVPLVAKGSIKKVYTILYKYNRGILQGAIWTE